MGDFTPRSWTKVSRPSARSCARATDLRTRPTVGTPISPIAIVLRRSIASPVSASNATLDAIGLDSARRFLDAHHHPSNAIRHRRATSSEPSRSCAKFGDVEEASIDRRRMEDLEAEHREEIVEVPGSMAPSSPPRGLFRLRVGRDLRDCRRDKQSASYRSSAASPTAPRVDEETTVEPCSSSHR